MNEVRQCEVCHRTREIVGVFASQLGPISLAYCKECSEHGAEAESLFEHTAWSCGDNVHDGIKGIETYRDGKYVAWSEWYPLYGKAAADRLEESCKQYFAATDQKRGEARPDLQKPDQIS